MDNKKRGFRRGDWVKVERKKLSAQQLESDYTMETLPPDEGMVCFVHPEERFVTVQFFTQFGGCLYRESFWPEKLSLVQRTEVGA